MGTRPTTRGLLSLMGLALLAAGCGDDGAAPMDAGGGDADTGSDAGDAGDASTETASLTFNIRRPVGPDEFEPAAGAEFAFDKPGGERVERTVPDDGMVTIDGIDWSQGTAAWAGYLEGHVVGSAAGFDAEDAERARTRTDGDAITLTFNPMDDPPEAVELSGTAINMADSTHQLTVSATSAVGVHTGVGGSWSLQVKSGEPFTVVANERHPAADPDLVSDRGIGIVFDSWVVVEHEAITEDTTLELDMGDPATVETFSGSYPMPDRPESDFFSSARLFVNVRAHEPDAVGAYAGVVTKLDIVDGTVEYEGEHVTLPTSPDRVVTQYSFSQTPELSAVFAAGFPEDGPLDLAFAGPPDVTTPSFGTPHPLHDPMEWTLHEDDLARDDLVINVAIFDVSGESDELVWLVNHPAGTTDTAIPELPSAVDPASVLGGDAYDARVQICGQSEDPDARQGCSPFAQSRAFGVVPPGG